MVRSQALKMDVLPMPVQSSEFRSMPDATEAGHIDFEAWRIRIRQTTFANYHYQMGVALARTGEADAAIAAMQRAVDTDATLVEARMRLKECLLQAGRAQQAAEIHRAAIACDPNYEARAHARIAMEHYGRGDYGAAQDEANRAIAIDAALDEAQCAYGLVLLRRGEIDGGLAALDRAVAGGATSRSRALEEAVRAADDAMRSHDYAAAFAAARWAADRAPASAEAARTAGRAASYTGQLSESRHYLGQAVAHDPSDIRSLGLLAYVLERLGLANEAADGFERMVSVATSAGQPQQAAIGQCGSGRLLLAAGRNDDALERFEQAVRLAPGLSTAVAHRALGKLAQRDRAAALADARQAHGLNADDPWALTALGTVLVSSGDPQVGLPLLQRPAERNPDVVWTLLDFACGLAMAGEEAQARAMFQRASAALPSDGIALLAAERPWAAAVMAKLAGG